MASTFSTAMRTRQLCGTLEQTCLALPRLMRTSPRQLNRSFHSSYRGLERPFTLHSQKLLRNIRNHRSFTSTPSRFGGAGHGAGHESQYDEPGGWLFGIPPGQKYQKEGWENTWIFGFWGSLLLGVVLYAYKPDTTIQTWALEEARRRLEAEGILEDPFPNGPRTRRSDQPEVMPNQEQGNRGEA